MKIKVADIVPNPYRKMNQYPIDRAKVEALKTSIQEKTFWDNILLRKRGGKYELAYGHHRWMALLELGIKEIDVPVRAIDDATMLRIMAEENLNWSTNPAVMTQTILAAKEYLDAELAKYKRLETSPEIWRGLFDSQRAFETAKGMGVGEPTLTKFLGGNWTKHKVGEALKIIKDESLDMAAVRTIPTMEQAKVFRRAVKEHQIPKRTQKKIATKIAKEGVGCRDIPDLVAEHAPIILPAKKETKKQKELPNIVEFLNKCETDADNLNRRLNALIPHLADIVKNRRLSTRLVSALKQLSKTAQDIIGEYEKQKKRTDSTICLKS